MPLVIHEGNALPGLGESGRCAFRRRRGDVVSRHQAQRALGSSGCRSAGRSRPSTGPRCASWRATTSVSTQDLPTLLVTGGSQGARRINGVDLGGESRLRGRRRAGAARQGPEGRGRGPGRPRRQRAARTSWCRTSTGWISRTQRPTRPWPASGANSVTEAAAVGLPAVFVPLPIGNGEQALNAAAVVKAGGALLVDDASFTPEWVREHLPALLNDDRPAGRDERGRNRPDPSRCRRRAGPADRARRRSR